MYREGMKMEARQYREHLDLAIVPAMKLEYYRQLRARYNRMIDPKPVVLPPKPPDYYIKADSQECKDLIFGIFNAAKRSSGRG
jgi:hypothetical protein